MSKLQLIEKFLEDKTYHVIPIGGKEPTHLASENCWCHPLKNENGTMVHNALDCREQFERTHDRSRSEDEVWIIVASE